MLKLGVQIFSRLPLVLLFALAEFFTWFTFFITKYRRNEVHKNLKSAFPKKSTKELRKISYRFYRHFFQVWAETLKGARFDKKDWHKRISYKGIDQINADLDDGKSVIFLAGHIANWEWSGSGTTAFTNHKVTVFYKEVKKSSFGSEILKIRKKGGLNPVLKDSALRYLLKTKNEPQLIGMISDQIPAIGSEKYWLNFLNKESAFYQGAEKFSLLMKYPVYFADMRKIKPGYYQIEAKRIYDGEAEITQGQIIKRYAELLEETIRANPSDYLWSHKRWKYTKEQASEVTGRPYLFIS